MEDFRKYATKHLGMSGTALDSYMNISSSYISPTIIEERQLNVAQMDVFSRLMMDRIIFLGTQVDDYTANVIQAQLLYLDSSDPGKDISIYINSPVALYMRATAFTTRCSLSPATYLRFVRVWPPLWRLSYWWREPRENVSA
jgi:hypothetical protein